MQCQCFGNLHTVNVYERMST